MKAERERAGLTQAEQIERAGCNLFTLSKLVRGPGVPRPSLDLQPRHAMTQERSRRLIVTYSPLTYRPLPP
jgi:hypothetical protein